jgi:metal-dependent amidase/aminoacylase/carboxypeptidase family protein
VDVAGQFRVSYVRIGTGEGRKGACVVHNPHYDFNDDVLTFGASYWTTLVEQQRALQA